MLSVVARFTVFLSALLVFTLTGCAKRPATTQATSSAPRGPAVGAHAGPSAPSGAPAPDAVRQQPGSGTTTGPTTAITARPSPKDFLPDASLKDVFFGFDRYNIDLQDARTLDSNAQWLKSHPDLLVLIEGHCDGRGTNEYNLALGQLRATTTMNYLVSQGVPRHRISILSYGEARPVCTDPVEACWTKNRRAHFRVAPR